MVIFAKRREYYLLKTAGDDVNKKIIAPLANANKLVSMPDFNDPEKLGSGKETGFTV